MATDADAGREEEGLPVGVGGVEEFDGVEPSWLAVYLGQRVMPQFYDPMADALPVDELERRLQNVREQVASTAQRMPSHEDFLARYCPASTRMEAQA